MFCGVNNGVEGPPLINRLMVPLFLLVMSACLSGCGSMVATHQSCSATYSRYDMTWNCIRQQVAANRAGLMNNSQGVRFMAYGDMLLEKVRSKQLSDAEAKSLLATELDINDRSFNAERRANLETLRRSQGTTTNCYNTVYGVQCRSY